MRWIRLGMIAREARRSSGPGTPSWGERLSALPRWGASIGTGTYHGTAPGRLIRMLLASLYVVTPVDLVPEGLFALFGLTDDAIVIAWLVTAVSQETRRFLEWERAATGPQDRVRYADQWTAPAPWVPPGMAPQGAAGSYVAPRPYVAARPDLARRTAPMASPPPVPEPTFGPPIPPASRAPAAPPPLVPPAPSAQFASSPPSQLWAPPAPWHGPDRSWLDPTDDTIGHDRIR